MCFCRFWDDNAGDRSGQGVPDLLRSSGLCCHHPLLQPLLGAHHHAAGRGDEGCEGAANQEQRSAPARDPP